MKTRSNVLGWYLSVGLCLFAPLAFGHGPSPDLNKWCADTYATKFAKWAGEKIISKPVAKYNHQKGRWECIRPTVAMPQTKPPKPIAFHPKKACKAQFKTSKVHSHRRDTARIGEQTSVHCGRTNGWVKEKPKPPVAPTPAPQPQPTPQPQLPATWSAVGYGDDGFYAYAMGYTSEHAALAGMRKHCGGSCAQTFTTQAQCLSVVSDVSNQIWFVGTAGTHAAAEEQGKAQCNRFIMYCKTHVVNCR